MKLIKIRFGSIFLGLLLFFALIVCLNHCTKIQSPLEENKIDLVLNNNTNIKSVFRRGTLKYSYEANTQNNVTVSKLKISDYYDPRNLIVELKYTIDKNMPAYKLAQHESVLEESGRIRSKFSTDLISDVMNDFELFAKKMISNTQVDHSDEKIQSLFFHYAVLSTVKRSIERNADCECIPHPAYFIDKASFWCQQDYFINPNDYLKIIDESDYKMNETDKAVYLYLQSKKALNAISIDNLLEIYEPKSQFMEKVEKVYYRSTSRKLKSMSSHAALKKEECTKGSDLGCCGNYAGCCWYWSMLCLEHDIACLKCDHWYCGPQCKPGTK